MTDDDRDWILRRLAREHREQPDRGRHALAGYDFHLTRDCPVCLTRGGMTGAIRPGERVILTALVLNVDDPSDQQMVAMWARLVAVHPGDEKPNAYLRWSRR